MSVIRLSKETLIEQLTLRLPIAKKLDAAAVKKHKQDEANALKDYRSQLRACLKLSYEEAKNGRYSSARRQGGAKVELDAPSCPLLKENEMIKLIELVKVSEQQRYQIAQYGNNARIWQLLQIGLTETKAAC